MLTYRPIRTKREVSHTRLRVTADNDRRCVWQRLRVATETLYVAPVQWIDLNFAVGTHILTHVFICQYDKKSYQPGLTAKCVR